MPNKLPKIDLTPKEWQIFGPDDEYPDSHAVADSLNDAMRRALENKEAHIINRELSKWSRYGSNDTEPRAMSSAIWVAYFGDEAYDGWVEPRFVENVAKRLGIKYTAPKPLAVAVQPLIEWAETHGCPQDIIDEVRRAK